MELKESKSYNICFVGGSCTGKSTLAQAVAVALKMKALDVEYVSEYARDYLRRSGEILHYLEQFAIFVESSRREDERRIHDIVISDSSSFVGTAYMLRMQPKNLQGQEKLKWEYHFRIMQTLSAERLAEYSQIFYVPSGMFPARNDPTRKDAEFSHYMGNAIKNYLDTNGASYHTIQSKKLEERVEEVMKVLSADGLFKRK